MKLDHGGDNMIPEITNANLYLLLPGKVADVAMHVANHDHISPLDALRKFYSSATYKHLEQEETKLWHLGPVALFQEYQEFH